MGKMLSTEQAAEYCEMSPRTLEKLRSDGDGPVYAKLGHLVRYAIEDLDRWIAERRRRSTSDPGPVREPPEPASEPPGPEARP